MKLFDLIKKSRSYRRFDESYKINQELLEQLVTLARFSPTGANRQPLRFMIISDPELCDRVFPSLQWAGYLKEWDGPAKGERPTAYIVILGDKSITENFGVDHGIAAQSIMLGAVEAGLGGCMIASINRNELRNTLSIPGSFEILLVLALGKPVETIIIEDIVGGDVKYWRDSDNKHHVPKRLLRDLIIKF
jgi:nitroreductase